MRVVRIRKPASQALPIEVHIDDAQHHTDLEVVDRALLATGETRDRLTSTKVYRPISDTGRAVVTLYRD
jgi:hypothetical protein